MQQHPPCDLKRDSLFVQRGGAVSDLHPGGAVDQHRCLRIDSIFHEPIIAGGSQRAVTLLNSATLDRPMRAKVKRIRERGQRMSDHQIAAAIPVEGEARVYGMGGAIQATVTDPASQVGEPLIPILHEARLTTMHGAGMLPRGEERPQGDKGPAYIQEWSVRFDV